MSESVNTKLTVLVFFSSKVSDFIKIFDSCCKSTIRIKEKPYSNEQLTLGRKLKSLLVYEQLHT